MQLEECYFQMVNQLVGVGNQAHVELMVSALVIVEVLVYMFEGGEAAILIEVHSWTCD